MSMKRLALLAPLLLAACAGGESVTTSTVQTDALPFSVEPSSGSVDMLTSKRIYDRRRGTETFVAFVNDRENKGNLLVYHVNTGPGVLMNLTSAKGQVDRAMPTEVGHLQRESSDWQVAGYRTEGWIYAPNDKGVSCARFITPLERASGYDNAIVAGFDSALFGLFCLPGGTLDDSAVQKALGTIHLRP